MADDPSPFCDYPAWRPPVRLSLSVCPPHPCAYLPDRMAQMRAFRAERLSPDLYHQFMDAGFRRSGDAVYQPACGGCRQCLPLRVPVTSFEPSKSQRRVWRANGDVSTTVGPAVPSDEAFDLYRRYQLARHSSGVDDGDDGRESFEAFLYQSPVQTIEFMYRDAGGRLMAVGICDLCETSLSSVYFYFDPKLAGRSLGIFGGLFEIDWARRQGVPFYYLGYWVEQSPKMSYKRAFRPCQVLHPDGQWRDAWL